MRTSSRIILSVLLAAGIAAAAAAYSVSEAQEGRAVAKAREQSKDLNGKVVDKGEAAISGAVVYLKNTKSLAVKSFITNDAGEFHFHALSPNVDYEVYAEFNGARSGTKTVSSFDSRNKIEMTLKIDAKK